MRSATGGARTLDVLDAAADSPAGGLRAIGRYREEALAIARAERLGRVRTNFAIVPLEAPAAGTLRAGGEAFDAPRLLPASGRLTALAFGVCTLGDALEQRVKDLFAQRRISLAVALDTLGNRILLEAARRLQDRVLFAAGKAGLSVAGELRPGDPGLALAAQPAVLRLAGAALIGVAVTGSLALTPLKSASMVFGAGVDLPPALWSRCDDCRSRPGCRTAPARAAASA